jgi:hypothetical protein
MRPVTVFKISTGSTNPVPTNLFVTPFNLGIGVVVSGTVNYTVQHTFDDIWASNYSAASGNWFSHPSLAAQTANADGNYAFPVTAVRLTVNSGAGTATMTLIQAGVGQ